MKVCDLALFSTETSSGVRTYIENKIRYVTECQPGVEHLVIVPGREEQETIRGRSRFKVVRGVPTPYPGIRLCLNLLAVARVVEEFAPDVIEVNCQFTLAWAAFWATRRRHVPIVGVYHTDLPACARHMAAPAGAFVASAIERITEFYEGLIYRYCTVTVILQRGMYSRMTRMGVRDVQCLPCGVDPKVFHPGRRSEALRLRNDCGGGKIVVLYAGRLSAEKEVDVLLDAFDRLESDRFVLWIAGDGPLAAMIRRRAAASPEILYLGHFASPQDLAEVYASADVFVTPGRFETFGMATLEALACGTPVVGVLGSGSAGIVPDAVGALAAAGDPTALAQCISAVSLRASDELRNTCSRFAATNFSWRSVFERYFDLYRRSIKQREWKEAA